MIRIDKFKSASGVPGEQWSAPPVILRSSVD